MGFENVEVMIPFVRTPGEAKQVSDLLSLHQLNRGEHGLKLIMIITCKCLNSGTIFKVF